MSLYKSFKWLAPDDVWRIEVGENDEGIYIRAYDKEQSKNPEADIMLDRAAAYGLGKALVELATGEPYGR